MATITIYAPGVIVAVGVASDQDVVAGGVPVRIASLHYRSVGGSVGRAWITDAGGSIPKWESQPDAQAERTEFDPPLELDGRRINNNLSAAPLFIYTG